MFVNRLVLPALLSAALAVPASAQKAVEQRATASPDGMVRIYNLVGSVRVTGWARDSIAVSGKVREGREPFFFHADSAGAKLGIWDAADAAPGPSHFQVWVPARSTVWIKTAGADVIVEGVTGGVDVSAVAGRIEVSGQPSEVHAESLGGEVRVHARTRFARIKTATSPVVLGGDLADVVATTVGGAITVEGSAIQRGRFETVDGDIRYTGTVGRKSTLDFITHAGTVAFTLARDAAAEFSINTYEGGFDDRFGVDARTTGSAVKGRDIYFRVGQGGAGVVTVRSFKGRVILGAR